MGRNAFRVGSLLKTGELEAKKVGSLAVDGRDTLKVVPKWLASSELMIPS